MTEKTTDKERRAAIGGEFETTAVRSRPFRGCLGHRICPGGSWTISGRGAFAVILRRLMERGVSHVHLPSYLCESLLIPVKLLGLEFSFYPVDLSLTAHPEPPPGAALLLIHYFGWLNPATERLRSEAGSSYHLIEDFSQSMLSGAGEYATGKSLAFFSARKFAPVPLGGWCSEAGSLQDGDAEVASVLERSMNARRVKGEYLAHREGGIDTMIEAGYLRELGFVESYLDGRFEYRLPQSVLEIMAGVDWDEVSGRRRDNWLYMKESLPGHLTMLEQELPPGTVPLGCVILSKERDNLRKKLAEKRIFCPVHWRMPDEVSKTDFPEALFLSENCLTIPIDQRYDRNDLSRVADVLKRM